MRTRILFYVQHLLGIGHLVRAARIAAALAESFDVLLVVGGELPPGVVFDGVDVVSLPPARAGAAGFGALVHPDGTPFGSEDKARRRDLLLERFDAFVPNVVLLEAFPFGRRQMRFELIPLLELAATAVQRPLVACSIRDILQETRPERRMETLSLIRRHIGLVLVHGDPRVVELSESFPEAERFAELIRYTGMVGPDPRQTHDDDTGPAETFDVVVSVGGGAVGARLLAAAREARPLTSLSRARWLVLTGPNAASESAQGEVTPGVTLRRFVPDLAARLARARVSVSQAGYNTVADLVAARCRAVLVPFASGGETEQTRRAALVAERGLAVSLPEEGLEPPFLAAAIERALALPQPGASVALDGGARTREILEHRLGLRPAGSGRTW